MSLDRTDTVPTPTANTPAPPSPAERRRIRRLVRRLRHEAIAFKRLSAVLALALIAVLFAAVTGAARQDDGAVELGKGLAGVRALQPNPTAAEKPVAAPGEAPPLPVLRRSVARLLGRGEASYYHHSLEGRPTASGTPYRGARMTAAHRTLPLGSKLRVTNVRNGRSVVVEVNDRGPFHGRRVIDLSKAAAAELGMLSAGRAQVELELLDS